MSFKIRWIPIDFRLIFVGSYWFRLELLLIPIDILFLPTWFLLTSVWSRFDSYWIQFQTLLIATDLLFVSIYKPLLTPIDFPFNVRWSSYWFPCYIYIYIHTTRLYTSSGWYVHGACSMLYITLQVALELWTSDPITPPAQGKFLPGPKLCFSCTPKLPAPKDTCIHVNRRCRNHYIYI